MKMQTYILKNLPLNEDEKKFVPAIVAEIAQEIESGELDDTGMGQIYESTLADVFDEKLQKRMFPN